MKTSGRTWGQSEKPKPTWGQSRQSTVIHRDFSWDRDEERRLKDLPKDHQNRIRGVLDTIRKRAPRTTGRDPLGDRPAPRAFSAQMIKWMVSYYHDGGPMTIRLNGEGEMSKLIAITTEEKSWEDSWSVEFFDLVVAGITDAYEDGVISGTWKKEKVKTDELDHNGNGSHEVTIKKKPSSYEPSTGKVGIHYQQSSKGWKLDIRTIKSPTGSVGHIRKKGNFDAEGHVTNPIYAVLEEWDKVDSEMRKGRSSSERKVIAGELLAAARKIISD